MNVILAVKISTMAVVAMMKMMTKVAMSDRKKGDIDAEDGSS